MATLTKSGELSAGSSRLRDGDLRRRPLIAAGLYAAAWAAPTVTHLLGIDLLLLPVIWIATASLLKVGSTLLDRLMATTCLLAGYFIAAGLVFSLWPWGLHPVAVTGLTLSVLVTIGVVSGRRPALPRRVLGSDIIIVVAPVVSYLLLRAPVRGEDFTGMLPFVAARQDFFAHYAHFDAIRHVGGFTFLKGPEASKILEYPGQYVYPSGSHYLWALFDVFRTSSTDPGDSLHEFLRYYQYEALGVAFVAMATAWAARWVAGPALGGWRRSLVCSVVASFAVFGQLSTLFWQGYDAEALSLAFLALGVALIVRPPAHGREQILVMGAAMVITAHTYSLFVAYSGSAVLCALIVYRRRILKHWRFALVTALVAIPLTVLPFYLAKAYTITGANDTQSLFTQGGTTLRYSRSLSVMMAVIAMAPLATRAGRRLPRWWVMGGLVVLSTAFALYAGYIGYSAMHETRYYYEKMVEGCWVIALAGFGGVALFLKPSVAPPVKARHRFAEVPACIAACLVGVLMANGLPLARIEWREGPRPNQDASWAALWAKGDITAPYAGVLAEYGRHYRFGDGVPTGMVYSDSGEDNKHVTMFLSALSHTSGLGGLDGIAGAYGLASMKAPAKGRSITKKQADAVDLLESWIKAQPHGFRIVVGNDYLAKLLRQYASRNPVFRLDVVSLPGIG